MEQKWCWWLCYDSVQLSTVNLNINIGNQKVICFGFASNIKIINLLKSSVQQKIKQKHFLELHLVFKKFTYLDFRNDTCFHIICKYCKCQEKKAYTKLSHLLIDIWNTLHVCSSIDSMLKEIFKCFFITKSPNYII